MQPPRGVSTIQGNFLSGEVQEEVWRYVRDPERGRVKSRPVLGRGVGDDVSEEELDELERGYIDIERAAHIDTQNGDHVPQQANEDSTGERKLSLKERDEAEGRVVDVVLSDMSEPWEQTTGLWVRSVSNVYRRMQNTSGIAFKDHAGSMVSLSLPHSSLRSLKDCRIYAMRRCSSASPLFAPVDTLYASFTKERRIKRWKSD